MIQITLSNNFILNLNKIPSSRRLFQPIFAYFINFDDLWLYCYD